MSYFSINKALQFDICPQVPNPLSPFCCNRLLCYTCGDKRSYSQDDFVLNIIFMRVVLFFDSVLFIGHTLKVGGG